MANEQGADPEAPRGEEENNHEAPRAGAGTCGANTEIGVWVYFGLIFLGLIVYLLIRQTRAARRLAAELEAERSRRGIFARR
jgi:cbb3-type cytochrome oxidase subunit 3